MYKFLTFFLLSLSLQAAFAKDASINQADPNMAQSNQGFGGLPYDGAVPCAGCLDHQKQGTLFDPVIGSNDLMLMGSGPDVNRGFAPGKGTK